MLFQYILHIDNVSLFEFFIQIILFYNAIQIIKQDNFYYILAYFINFIFFIGLYLILFDLDIVCIILWILYGGVVIIFFIYSLLWFENIKNTKYISKFRYIYYFFSFIFFIYFSSVTNSSIVHTELNNFSVYSWTDFYRQLASDTGEELENVGAGILYFSTFFFIIVSYMLFIACCVSIVIILNAKKIKYINLILNFAFLKKDISLLPFHIYKYQNFYTQDYENINQIYSLNKNFKITNKFHKIKNFNRRI